MALPLNGSDIDAMGNTQWCDGYSQINIDALKNAMGNKGGKAKAALKIKEMTICGDDGSDDEIFDVGSDHSGYDGSDGGSDDGGDDGGVDTGLSLVVRRMPACA